MDLKVKNTVKCMIIGSALFNIVVIVVALIFFILFRSEDKYLLIKNLLSIVIGFMCSAINIYVMAESLYKALSSNDEKYAKNHVVFITVIRMIILCAILAIVYKVFGFIPFIFFAVASFGTKMGSYLAPIIEKKIEKKG